ncbi:chitooligosaccharide deacetylase [Nocardia neocaledoniensis NBRC 108232]|uniref:Peptidoglycan/xylan/chitin deacetylase (PgdA/CDA1 family) n=1 Tax=Nocardia neocaledoniensis TaxID=236511 RepID=A0A317NEI5_9NOCA|nr:polysaccharide deacetylase family protein [Nocardia neocaledoniensis]PWV73512.1 peptidoglycan/xylan/chitin deacetylase (PgdA/CDA1 family) [Nocardia neocaledoniensis]GEM34624.1 chitooligosaccharide deacetylase [Nocardia neocaledoniensis NBRC 108232]
MRKWLIGGAAALVTVLAVAAGLYVLMNSRTYQLAGRLVDRVATEEKLVALTFDDGPTDRTPEILRTLAELRVTGTFYLIGDNLAAHPDYGAAIAAAGHEIGNHSYTHRRMVLISGDTARDEVERTDAEIRRTGYQGEITFRPPYGKKLWSLPRYLSEHDRTTVTWDVEPDSAGGASRDAIVADTLAQTRPGSIVLLHVMHGSESLAALPAVVAGLRAQGYQFTTVSDLLKRAN